jgi:hypothetical protein
MLHLAATMNMETFFIPALYLVLLLWVVAEEGTRERQRSVSFVAGLVLGIATIFRPTSALLICALGLLFFWERPRRLWRQLWMQGRWLLIGFALPMALLLIRHRIAWGQWTLAGVKGPLSSLQNYALVVDGQHPVQIGIGPWLRLVADDPGVIWHHVIPAWWEQWLYLWTHPGFGQMDLLLGLHHVGPYQATLTSILVGGILVGVGVALRRRSRLDLILVALPVYFSALVFVFYVLNSRYRAPFIPALYLLCCSGFYAAIATVRGGMTARNS